MGSPQDREGNLRIVGLNKFLNIAVLLELLSVVVGRKGQDGETLTKLLL
jgi:hypothetical protein